jgi:hypothetical protein
VRNAKWLSPRNAGKDASNEKQQQEGRVADKHGGKRHGRDGLLDQTAHLLNHRQAVGGLHAGALQAVVEDRVFIDGNVERSGLAHDFDADVMGVAIGKQVVEVIDRARKNAGDYGKRHLRADQPPEVHRQGFVQTNLIDAVNDVASHDADADGEERNQNANGEVPKNHRGARLPDEFQHRRDVLQRANAVAPGITGLRSLLGLARIGLADRARIMNGRRHVSLQDG